MFREYGVAGVMLALFLGVSAPAQAVVIDFESLRHEADTIINIGDSYSEAGFTFITYHPTALHQPFAVMGTLESRFAGSTALFTRTIEAITRLTHFDHSEFSIQSIDLANLNRPGLTSVTFTGMKNDFSTVNQTFTFDSFGALTTAVFGPQFANLISLEWREDAPFHQFDNLHLTASESVSAVPEPATLILLGTGIAALAARARRVPR